MEAPLSPRPEVSLYHRTFQISFEVHLQTPPCSCTACGHWTCLASTESVDRWMVDLNLIIKKNRRSWVVEQNWLSYLFCEWSSLSRAPLIFKWSCFGFSNQLQLLSIPEQSRTTDSFLFLQQYQSTTKLASLWTEDNLLQHVLTRALQAGFFNISWVRGCVLKKVR